MIKIINTHFKQIQSFIIILQIIFFCVLSSCFYMPRIASYAYLQNTRNVPPDQVITITTISDSLSLSDFDNVSEQDMQKVNLAYQIRKRTRSVTLMPGIQTFTVSYRDIHFRKYKEITINTEAGATYTINYSDNDREIRIWVVNDHTNLPITEKIIL